MYCYVHFRFLNWPVTAQLRIRRKLADLGHQPILLECHLKITFHKRLRSNLHVGNICVACYGRISIFSLAYLPPLMHLFSKLDFIQNSTACLSKGLSKPANLITLQKKWTRMLKAPTLQILTIKRSYLLT